MNRPSDESLVPEIVRLADTLELYPNATIQVDTDNWCIYNKDKLFITGKGDYPNISLFKVLMVLLWRKGFTFTYTETLEKAQEMPLP